MILAVATIGTKRIAPGMPHIQNQKTSEIMTMTGLRVNRLATSIGVTSLALDQMQSEIEGRGKQRLPERAQQNHIHFDRNGSIEMTNAERSTYEPFFTPSSSPGDAHAADDSKDELASQGADAFRGIKANVESVIADAGEKGQQALSYAGRKGQEAVDSMRDVGDTLAVAVEKSVTKRPYATLALALGLGFLLGATWRR
jgi:ElaB/YqjD/DUF883 family membrane-anchored ribosome-binding protein